MKSALAILALGLMLAGAAESNPAPSLEQADALIQQHQLDRALEVLDALPEESDKAGLVSFNRARAFFRKGNFDRAEDQIDRAIRKDDRNAGFHELKGAIHARQIDDAGMFGKMSLAGKMRRSFERAVELAPDNVDYRRSLFEFYLNAPGIAGGGTDKAARQAEAIAALDPKAGYLTRLQVQFQEEELTEAEKLFKEATERFPRDASLYAVATIGFANAESYDRSHEAVQRWRESMPDDAGAMYQHGRLAAVSGKYLEEGAKAMRAYLEADRGDTDPPVYWAHYRLGLILKRLGDEETAGAEFEQARELGRDDERLMKSLDDLD